MSNNVSSSGEALSRLPKFIRRIFNRRQATRRPRVGIALSCGGAKGLAHIGVLEILEKHGIQIDAVAGTSMGGYIGSLWATGHNAEEMIALAEEMDRPTLKKLADPVIPPIRGLFKGIKAKAHLGKSIGEVTFESLDRKLFIIAADLDTHERIVFREGDVLSAVHASCAMPGIVVPVEVNGRRCCDGGVVDPVPVGALQKFADVDYVIAVSTVPTLQDIDDHEKARAIEQEEDEEELSWWRAILGKLGAKFNPIAYGNLIDSLRRALRASQIRIAHYSCKQADLTINLPVWNANWHAYEDYAHFIQIGREAAEAALPEILNLTKPISNNAPPKKPMVGDRVA